MIPCPECDHTDYHGKVEKEVHQRFGGTLEPVGQWVDCDHCDGSGEVEDEEEESDETVVKFPQLSEADKQFTELERQRDLIKEQADLIKNHRTSPSEYP